MGFALSGSVITQTGTDTNLGGLSAIAGVIVTTIGGLRIYRLDTATLVVDGNLQFNSEIEELHYTGISQRPLIINGTLTVGGSISVNGFIRPARGVGIRMHRVVVNGWNTESNIYITSTGTLNLLSAGIYTLGNIEAIAGSTVNVKNGAFLMQRPTPSAFEEPRLKMGGTVNIDGIQLVGGSMITVTQGANVIQLKGIEAFQTGATLIQEDVGLGQTVTQRWLQVENYNGAIQNGGLADVSLYRGSLIRLYNFSRAAEVVVESNGWVTGRDNLIEVRRKVNVKASNLNGPISGGVVYIKSVDNGARRNATINGNVTVDYTTSDDVYIASTVNGSLVNDFDILCLVGGFRFPTLSYSYTWKDYRHNGGMQFDNTVHLLSYESLYASSAVSFNGNGTLLPSIGALLDTSLTLTKAQAAALTTFNTLDEVHAACKNWKCQPIQSVIEYLGPNIYPSVLSGDKLDLGALNLVLDGTATVPFKINTA